MSKCNYHPLSFRLVFENTLCWTGRMSCNQLEAFRAGTVSQPAKSSRRHTQWVFFLQSQCEVASHCCLTPAELQPPSPAETSTAATLSYLLSGDGRDAAVINYNKHTNCSFCRYLCMFMLVIPSQFLVFVMRFRGFFFVLRFSFYSLLWCVVSILCCNI